MVSASLDSRKFENKLAIFSAGLGNFYNELLQDVGDKMSMDARSRAPFGNRSGRLLASINFLTNANDNKGALTTRERFGASNVWYAWARERGAYIKPRNRPFITFRVNGEWRRISKTGGKTGRTGVRTPAQPFAMPTWREYWSGKKAKGYRELAEALQRKMVEELV